MSRAIELDPKSAAAYQIRGLAKFNAADFKEASTEMLRALELRDDIDTMLFRYLARARAGETLAAAELEADATRLKTKEWPYAVIELYLGRRSPDLTLDAAGTPQQQREALFYNGEWYIVHRQPEAQAALRKAAEICPKGFSEYHAAQAELNRIRS